MSPPGSVGFGAGHTVGPHGTQIRQGIAPPSIPSKNCPGCEGGPDAYDRDTPVTYIAGVNDGVPICNPIPMTAPGA